VDRLELSSGRSRNWLVWLFGAALLGAVVIAAVHFSEEREFARLLEQAHPSWLLLAASLQAMTYLAEGEVWRSVTRADGRGISLRLAYELAIAKLFIDQALPTGGISGTILYVQGLERAGVRRGAALAGVVVVTFSYYASYVLCLSVAVVMAAARTDLSGIVTGIAPAFLIVSTAFAVAVLLQSGREPGPITQRLERLPVLRKGLRLLREADPTLAQSPRLLGGAVGWQIMIVLLDATTIWVLLHAVGVAARPSVVFTSYMFSSLLRTLGVVPGGLGVFEAAAVFMLRGAGIPISAALAATLLFRGLSYWLPMLPGLLFARRLLAGPNRDASRRANDTNP
jgi:uncharacterized protein (TIRG00374 family)